MKFQKLFGIGVTLALTGATFAIGAIGCSSKAGPAAVAGAESDGGSHDASPDGGVVPSDDAGDDADPGNVDAGPTPQCSEYCKAVMSNCTGAFGAAGSNAVYPSVDACNAQCGQINAGEYNDPDFDDTLGCRLVHANKAKSDPKGNCAAASATGGGVCNDMSTDAGVQARCADFCAQVTSICTKDNGVDPVPYADADTCMKACGSSFKFDPTQPELTQTGNTLNCRQYHLSLAFDTADGANGAVYHCPHLAFPASAFCR